jgi:Tfp pilus assembly protein PilO
MAMLNDQLAKLSPRERTFLALMVVVVLAVLANWFVVRPVRSGFQDLNTEIAREKRRVDGNVAKLDPHRVQAIRAEYKRLGRRIATRSTPSEEQAQILGEVEGLARQAKLNLLGTKAREPRAQRSYEEYPMEVDVEGDLSGVMAFLYGLQRSPQLLRITELTLTPKGREAASAVKAVAVITRVVGV